MTYISVLANHPFIVLELAGGGSGLNRANQYTPLVKGKKVCYSLLAGSLNIYLDGG